MKFHCARKDLQLAVGLIESVVPYKSTRPILRNLLLEAGDRGVRVTGTDLEVSARCFIAGEVEEQGKTVLLVQRLAGVLKESTAEEVFFEEKDGRAEVRLGEDYFRLVCDVSDDYPAVPEIDRSGMVTVDKNVLLDLIKMTAFAADRERTRYDLNGVFVTTVDGKLTMVATDGKRLALAERSVEKVPAVSEGAIVPLPALRHLQRMLEVASEPQAELAVTSGEIRVVVGDSELSARLIDGRFPKYSAVIPESSDIRVEMDKDTLASALRRAQVLTSQENQMVKMVFSSSGLVIEAETPEAGLAKVPVPLQGETPDFMIAFNPAYLLEMLKAIELPRVVAEFTDSGSAALFRTGEGSLCVVMPVEF